MRYQIDGVYGEIDSLPGCTQVAVSHAVYVPLGQRGQGKATVANEARLKKLKDELGYDYVLCTVNAANEWERKVLMKNNWKCLSSFKSSKTEHTVEVWGCQL